MSADLRKLIDDGRLDDALRLLESLDENTAESKQDLFFESGRLFYKLGRYPSAAARFIATVREPDCKPNKIRLMVELLLDRKLFAQALEVAVQGLDRFHDNADTLSAYGRVLYGMKHYALAAPAFIMAYQADSTSEQYPRLCGLCLLYLGRYSEAKYWIDISENVNPEKAIIPPYLPVDILRAAATQVPGWAWVSYHLGMAMFETRNFAAAETSFAVAWEQSADGTKLNDHARTMHLEVVRRQYPTQEALGKLQMLLATPSGDKVWKPLAAGLVAFSQSDTAATERWFAQVEPGLGLLTKVGVGSSTFSTLDNYSPLAAKEMADPSSMAPALRCRDDDDYLVFAAADGRYVELFLRNFVASILHTCGDRPIHVHVINPSPASDTAFSEISAALPWARLSSSSEQSSFPSPRPYYATSRFLLAPSLLKAAKIPVVIADIDAVFIKDPAPGLTTVDEADVALKFNASNRLEYPWTSIFATFSIYFPGNGSQLFLDALEHYFWQLYDRHGKSNSWWIDQNAIYYAWKLALIDGRASRIINIADIPALDGCIMVNEAMGDKHKFADMMAKRFSIDKLRNHPIAR